MPTPLEQYMALMGAQNHSYDPSIDQPVPQPSAIERYLSLGQPFGTPNAPDVGSYLEKLTPFSANNIYGSNSPSEVPPAQMPLEAPVEAPLPPISEAPLAPQAPQVAPYNPAQGIQQGFDMQNLGGMGSLQLQGQAEAEKAKAYENLAISQGRIEQKRLQDEAFRQEKIKESEGEYVKAIDEFKGKEVDPQRFWKSKGAWGQALGALAIGLNEFTVGVQGRGQNTALAILDRAIDRDIDAQKSEIDKLGTAVNMKNNLLANMRARFSDERQAEAATRAAMLESVNNKINLIGAKTSSQDVKNKLLTMSGDLETKKADAMIRFGEQAAKIKELQQKGNELEVPGYGRALDVDSAKKAREIVGNANAVNSAIQQLKQIREEYGAEFLNRDAVRRGSTAKTALELSLKQALQLGTLDKGSEEYLQRLVADPTGIGFNSASLDELERTMKSQTSNKLAPLGIEYSSEPDVTYTTKKEIKGPDGSVIPAGTIMKKVDGGWTPIR